MQRLLLFAKRPRPGQVKTRLVPPLTTAQAVELARAFIADQIAFLGTFAGDCEIEICADGDWRPDVAAAPSLAVGRQGPGDLGERMLRCFRRSARNNATATLALAADAPTLPRGHVLQALEHLRAGAPAVVAPAEDGGYVMLGLDRPHAGLFRDVPWGGPDVLAVTRRRAASISLELLEIEPWYDVDDAAGLERLRREMTRPAVRLRAPATARLLACLDGA